MSHAIEACSPEVNSTVSASAGTGKTWLLVSRIVRLLLAGAKPDSILAITFTNKAATEMAERLMARLYQLAVADDDELTSLLEQTGLDANQQDHAHARGLYEMLLSSQQGVNISTFHAFSQHVLRRFPLEADIAANFELAETTELLRQEAWNVLMDETTAQPQSRLARSLEALMSRCNGPYNARLALFSFLDHRSDWWALAQDESDPVASVCESIASMLGIDPAQPPQVDDFITLHRDALQEFSALLRKHDTKTNREHADLLDATLETGTGIDAILTVFLTNTGSPRKREVKPAWKKSMGEQGAYRFVDIHESISSLLLSFQDMLSRYNTYELNRDWLIAGTALLENYQRVKGNQRTLDFADLEWKACHLINKADNAHWIQYKLDQRINHLLVDEFQDTNPTQWRLLKPLLEELATAEQDRQRSCFIVGDSKQSIYGFRRADSSLFVEAENWLSQQLGATTLPLQTSWRSSPAIIDFVNMLFGSGPPGQDIQTFATHDTHRKQLWGRVELLPLFEEPETTAPQDETELRNPLLAPRADTEDSRYANEAANVAGRINDLINSGLQIDAGDQQRPIHYSDIMILLRTRTKAATYEAALRELGIPYFGADRGTLLERIEIADMMALLDVLVTPHDNLALARVLRSPLFSFENNLLIDISERAQQHRSEWMTALHSLAGDSNAAEKMITASRMLSSWHSLCGMLPVHDLLDRIYSEANVYERFTAAAPAHLHSSIHANLNRFIELALEIDSGRYPSMSQFRAHLRAMSEFAPDKINEAPSTGDMDRVHIMTIHGSKGLEAPVVFLVDSARPAENRDTYKSLVSWPTQRDKPEFMLLLPRQQERDSKLLELQQKQAMRDTHEQANLLYVAITRARQMLVISACKPKRSDKLGWFGQICEQIDNIKGIDSTHDGYIATYSEPGHLDRASVTTIEHINSSDINKLIPNLSTGRQTEIAPSRQSAWQLESKESHYVACIDDVDGIGARQRGILIHRMLEKLSTCEPENYRTLYDDFSSEHVGMFTQDFIDTCWHEATTAITDCPRPDWFQAGNNSFNEIPLIYTDTDSGRTVHGVIDRLVINAEDVLIIDYKTHASASVETVPEIARRYEDQMRYYIKGIEKMWPGKKVNAWLYFTHCLGVVECYS